MAFFFFRLKCKIWTLKYMHARHFCITYEIFKIIFFIWNLIDMTIWKLKGWIDVHSCARIWGLLICCSICMLLYLSLQCYYSLFYHALSDLWPSGRQPDGHDNRGQKNCPDFWDEGGYRPLSNRYTYLTVWCQMLGHQTMNLRGFYKRGKVSRRNVRVIYK